MFVALLLVDYLASPTVRNAVYKKRFIIYGLAMGVIIMLMCYNSLTSETLRFRIWGARVDKWGFQVMFPLYVYAFALMVVLHRIIRFRAFILTSLYLYYIAVLWGTGYYLRSVFEIIADIHGR